MILIVIFSSVFPQISEKVNMSRRGADFQGQ